jgi:glycosyltransferase involved in cell wall biosynthesis
VGVARRHVGLNALFLDPGRSGGSETYVRELVPRLVQARPDTRFTLVCSRRGASALRAEGWGEMLVLEALASDDDERLRKLFAEQVTLPWLTRRRRFDLLHSLANMAPIRVGRPSVMTILDVIYATHATMSWASRVAIWGVVRRAAPRADAVVAISAAARGEILAALPALDPARVSVVRLGGGRRGSEPEAIDTVRARVGLPPGARLVLCVGALRAHKNQVLLAPALRSLPADVHIVCVGSDTEQGDVVRATARDAGVEDRLHVPGYLGDGEVEALWRAADAAVSPTLAEGFGLPVVEALGRSVPVACSDLPVLREIAGDCAVYFDPHDPQDAARAISSALADPALARCGPGRAAGFSWERAAQETLDVYDRVLAAR